MKHRLANLMKNYIVIEAMRNTTTCQWSVSVEELETVFATALESEPMTREEIKSMVEEELYADYNDCVLDLYVDDTDPNGNAVFDIIMAGWLNPNAM